jgi:hypothetical protein
MRASTHSSTPRVRIEGTIVAGRQVPDTMNPDATIWKAQVRVKHDELVVPHDEDTYSLTDRVEITYPGHPPIGRKVKFTANVGNGRELKNPRGVAAWLPIEGKWHRIGG